MGKAAHPVRQRGFIKSTLPEGLAAPTPWWWCLSCVCVVCCILVWSSSLIGGGVGNALVGCMGDRVGVTNDRAGLISNVDS